MNIYTIIGKKGTYHITDGNLKSLCIVILLILLALITTSWLLGSYQGRIKLVGEIKQAIRGNRHKVVAGFEFYQDIKGQNFITLKNNYRIVSDISIAGAGDEGVRKEGNYGP